METEPIYEYTLKWKDGLFYNQSFASRLDAMDIADRYDPIGGPTIVKRLRRDDEWHVDE